jgi:hypothetical protein
VKDVAQRCGGEHRRDEEADEIPHPKFDRIHHRNLTPADFTYQELTQTEHHFPASALWQCEEMPPARPSRFGGAAIALRCKSASQSSAC